MTGLRIDAVRSVFETGLGQQIPVGEDAGGTPVVDVTPDQWLDAAKLARGALDLDFLDWLSAVDQTDAAQGAFEGPPAGFDVVLHVANSRSITHRLLLRTRVATDAAQLPSLTRYWPGVAWHERETHEMFGIVFEDFDDGQTDADGSPLGLRPLLLPDGFEGTPLRKSFVLTARVSKPWPGAKDPGEGEGRASPSRRKTRPPGVPDPQWGPHERE